LVAVTAIALLTACDARVELVQPKASAAPPVVLTLVASDTALAQRAGWSPGIPGTTVFIRRDQDPTILSLVSDVRGVLSLADLPAASYWVWAEKLSSGSELETPVLAPAALGGGRRIALGTEPAHVLQLRGQDNGSLVISEFYYNYPPAAVTGGGYDLHFYIEVYNNADSTVFLDGKIVGAGFDYGIDAELWPCVETAPFRNEPRGIWSQEFQAFPGTGRDYPLAPGKAAVIAEQAIDHSALYPGLPDLSHADFQFFWPTRALNPAVPTMLPIQLRASPRQTMFLTLMSVPFVSEPVNVAALERRQGRYTGGDEALFPKEAILDVAALYGEFYLVPRSAPLCGTLVDASLDALAAFVIPSETRLDGHMLSAQRKLLPDGRHLQRTGTSAADWTIGPRSPGKVP
jgi:hypothetical protein